MMWNDFLFIETFSLWWVNILLSDPFGVDFSSGGSKKRKKNLDLDDLDMPSKKKGKAGKRWGLVDWEDSYADLILLACS